MNPEGDEPRDAIGRLLELLTEFRGGRGPAGRDRRAGGGGGGPVARRAVAEIERLELGDDRLGQAVRNLFECLGLGEEGAEISLRAGENPNSLTRPV